MSQTHLHLLITHLPIFGSILGGLVLVHGIWTKSSQTKIAAFNLFILSSVGAVIAYVTGEAAEETVENIRGVAENTIEQHEEFAQFALISLIILGVASILGVVITLKKSHLTKTVSTVILLISVISFGLAARTGYLGGKIRHTELNKTTVVNQVQGQSDDDDD